MDAGAFDADVMEFMTGGVRGPLRLLAIAYTNAACPLCHCSIYLCSPFSIFHHLLHTIFDHRESVPGDWYRQSSK